MSAPPPRTITRPSGTWEVLGADETCARVDGVPYYWVALRRIDHWRYYSGVVRVPPQTAPEDELMPELEEVVRRCRTVSK